MALATVSITPCGILIVNPVIVIAIHKVKCVITYMVIKSETDCFNKCVNCIKILKKCVILKDTSIARL